MHISGLEVSQRQLVSRLIEPGLELQDFLKLLDRLRRLAFREMHFAQKNMPIEVRRAPLEDGVERLAALIVLSLVQGGFGQAAPPREEIWSLLGHLCEDSPPLLGFAR